MRSNSQPPQGSVFYSEYRGCHEGSLYQSNRPFSSIDVPPQSQAQRFRSYIAPHHLVHKQNGAIYRDPAALGRCPDANKVTKHHYPSLTATQHPFQGVAAGRPNQGPSYRRVRNRAGAAGPSEIDFVMDHRLMSSSSIATPAPPHPIIFVHPSGAIPSRIRTFGSTPWTPSITVPSTDPNRTKPKFTASSRAAYLKYWNRQSQQQDPACQCCAQKAAAVGASGAQEDCQGADCGSTRIPVRYITADHGTLSHGASHNRAASSSNARKGTSTIKRPNARRRCLSMSDGSMSESNGSHQNTITNVSQSVPVQHSATSEQESASKQGVCPGRVEPGEVHDWIPSKPPIQNDPAQRCRGKSCSHGPCNGVTQSQCRVNHQRPQSMVCKTQKSYDRIASSANQWRAGWRI